MPRTQRATQRANGTASSSRRSSSTRRRNPRNEDSQPDNQPTNGDEEATTHSTHRRILFPILSPTPTTPTNTTTATTNPPNTNNSTNSSNNHPVHGDDNGNPPSNSRRTPPQSLLEAVRGSAVLPQPRMRMSVSEMRAVTHQIMDTLMRKNTREAYKYRILEFRGFCATIYNWQTECTRFTVTGEKLYQFMFYQVFRDQKTNNKKPGVFNVVDYDRLCDKYVAILDAHNGTISGNESAILDEMEPRNPLGFSSISTYRSAIRKLYDYQAEEGNGSNSLNWDTQICTTSIKNLLKIVQVSTTIVNRTVIQMNV